MWQFTMTLTENQAGALSDALGDDVLSVSWFEDANDPSMRCFAAHFDEKPQDHVLFAALKTAQVMDRPYHLHRLEDRDWLAENRSSFPPIDVGPFYIYGSHISDPPPPHKIGFLIDAAVAFGTGQHGTTRGCLMALSTLKDKGFQCHNPLDMGCGTGILAMAITRLFDVPSLASDNDPEALSVVATNLKNNHLDHLITPVLAAGFDHPVLGSLAPYDLIVANILADPLIQLAPSMAHHTAPGAAIVLSGILKEQADKVSTAYGTAGFTLDHQMVMDEQWVCLTFYRR